MNLMNSYLIRQLPRFLLTWLLSFGFFTHVARAEDNIVILNGTHRTIAIVILFKRGLVSRDLNVGFFRNNGGKITAGELSDAFDAGRLRAAQPYFVPAKVEDIVRDFSMDLFMEAQRNNPQGGIWLNYNNHPDLTHFHQLWANLRPQLKVVEYCDRVVAEMTHMKKPE